MGSKMGQTEDEGRTHNKVLLQLGLDDAPLAQVFRRIT